jgi:hypothetical protein
VYESYTSPIEAPHTNQKSQEYFASGKFVTDSTFQIKYTDREVPDLGVINSDGSVTVSFTGTTSTGAMVSFGQWLFSAPYHGPSVNPAPHITGFDPAGVPAYTADTTVLINGSSFMRSSTVSLDGNELATAYVSSTQLRVSLPASLLAKPGTYLARVANPEPGGGTYFHPFIVTQPAPTITSISPSTLAAGSNLLGITVTGTGFDASTVVVWNGVPRPAILFTRTSLSIPIAAADLSTPGVIQVAVSNPPPGGGTSNSLPFTVTGTAPRLLQQVTVLAGATTLAGDPRLAVVYAGLDSTDRTHPNSVVALDAVTGRVMWSVPVSGTPSVLAVSADGQFLYVGKVTDSTISRIAVPAHAVDLAIPMGRSSTCPYHAAHIAVSPDNPRAIAVERQCINTRSGGTGITMYDDAVARPVSSTLAGDHLLQFSYGATASVIYAAGDGGNFYTIAVDGSGATTQSVTANYPGTGGLGPELLYVDRKLYSTTGNVYDPIARAPAQPLPLYPFWVYSIAAGRDDRTLYVLSANEQKLQAFDLDSRVSIGGIAIPNTRNQTRDMVRWGQDGVAFISGDVYTGGDIFLVRADFVH